MKKGHDVFEQKPSDTASDGPPSKCREVSPTPLEDDEGSEEGGGVSDCESCVQRLAASVVASNQGKGSCATWTVRVLHPAKERLERRSLARLEQSGRGEWPSARARGSVAFQD